MLDLTGDRVGRLVVLKEADTHVFPSGYKSRRWLCQCDCGNQHTLHQSALRSKTTLSCGCWAKERSTTHGLEGTRQYKIWVGLKVRCNNPKVQNWRHYGGRGITYDPKWETFEGFWEDMEEGYEDHLSLERLDGDKDYFKTNCSWVGKDIQARNQRKRSTNTSGITGVSLHIGKSGFTSWMASWIDTQGIKHSRHFAVTKYGYEGAFKLACQVRANAIEDLNSKGAGYSESHGK